MFFQIFVTKPNMILGFFVTKPNMIDFGVIFNHPKITLIPIELVHRIGGRFAQFVTYGQGPQYQFSTEIFV
jgi:hypothetical protein